MTYELYSISITILWFVILDNLHARRITLSPTIGYRQTKRIAVYVCVSEDVFNSSWSLKDIAGSWLLIAFSDIIVLLTGVCNVVKLALVRLPLVSFSFILLFLDPFSTDRRLATISRKNCILRAKSTFATSMSVVPIGVVPRNSRDPVSKSPRSSSSSKRRKSNRQHGHSSCERSHSAIQFRWKKWEQWGLWDQEISSPSS